MVRYYNVYYNVKFPSGSGTDPFWENKMKVSERLEWVGWVGGKHKKYPTENCHFEWVCKIAKWHF